jgi:hypothetical protein
MAAKASSIKQAGGIEGAAPQAQRRIAYGIKSPTIH